MAAATTPLVAAASNFSIIGTPSCNARRWWFPRPGVFTRSGRPAPMLALRSSRSQEPVPPGSLPGQGPAGTPPVWGIQAAGSCVWKSFADCRTVGLSPVVAQALHSDEIPIDADLVRGLVGRAMPAYA